MLDLIFCVLMIIIIVKANKGVVNDTLCNVALVFGFLAGIFGIIQAFSFKQYNSFWLLNILIMLMAFALKRVADHFAKLHNQKIEEMEERYRKAIEKNSQNAGTDRYANVDFDDPNVRFGGGNGKDWNGK